MSKKLFWLLAIALLLVGALIVVYKRSSGSDGPAANSSGALNESSQSAANNKLEPLPDKPLLGEIIEVGASQIKIKLGNDPRLGTIAIQISADTKITRELKPGVASVNPDDGKASISDLRKGQKVFVLVREEAKSPGVINYLARSIRISAEQEHKTPDEKEKK